MANIYLWGHDVSRVAGQSHLCDPYIEDCVEGRVSRTQEDFLLHQLMHFR